MRYHRLARQMAEAQDDDHYSTTSQQLITATLLGAVPLLCEQDRERFRIHLVDIGIRTVQGDSYAWRRIVTTD
jgi:hypothetical protein